MSEKIVVPVLGESITEATVAKWLKNTGDTVEADEPIVELETDKVNLEVPSPINGFFNRDKFKRWFGCRSRSIAWFGIRKWISKFSQKRRD
jgi:hypothetical protein